MRLERTTQQKEADEVDLMLYNALLKLETWRPRKEFAEAAVYLRQARIIVRRHMHERDRDATA